MNAEHETLARRRWMARPRSLWRGMLVSLLLHAAVAGLFLLVWHLLPLPPMKPIRISILPDAPTREELGLTPEGQLPADQIRRPEPSPSPATSPSPSPATSPSPIPSPTPTGTVSPAADETPAEPPQ